MAGRPKVQKVRGDARVLSPHSLEGWSAHLYHPAGMKRKEHGRRSRRNPRRLIHPPQSAAEPKSMSLSVWVMGSTSKFSGLMSRCVTPHACTCASTEQVMQHASWQRTLGAVQRARQLREASRVAQVKVKRRLTRGLPH